MVRTVRIYRYHPFLVLFSVLVVTQGAHVIEHVAQMVQIHVLGLSGAGARGIIGPLDIEWVHFVWNTWVLLALGLLLWRYPRNRWLWVTVVLAGWHELEHAVIMTRFLTTGQVGTPGLLALGGLLGGGLPLGRPDLHFLYNVIETVPLLASFDAQIQTSKGRN
jgi:hypothetical protein